MAKSKSDKKTTKKVLEDEESISQATDAEVDMDVSESAVDADEPEVDADADADVDAGDDDEEDRDQADEKPKPPRAKVTWLTIILIVLNWMAAPSFLVLAFLDHSARLQYSYRALYNYTQIWGVPLAEETKYPSVSNETRPIMRLTQAQLAEALKKRSPQSAAMGKDLQPVEEPPPLFLTVGDMTPELLLDIYGKEVPAEERYPTLEAAIEDLRTKLPAVVARAADDVKASLKAKKEDEKRTFVLKSIFIMTWDSAEANKMEDKVKNADAKDLDDLVKRAVVQKILFPIAMDYSDLQDEKKDGKVMQRRVWLVDRIEEDAAKAKGAELDALVDEAVKRRIYYDILAPINLYRPGDLKVTDVERIADRNKVKMDKVAELLDNRFKAAVDVKYVPAYNLGAEAWGNPHDRDSVEKRQKIAFILFTLSQVQIPVLDKRLYPKGIERAQTVSGIYEFTNASIAYVQTMRVHEQRMAARVVENRDGRTFGAPGNLMRTAGIIDEQPAQIDRMQRLVEYVDSADKRLKELIVQRDQLQKVYEQRVAQHKAVADRLIKARQGTEKYVKELRDLQDQLHAALLELSDAADTNFRLEAEIRALELSYYKTGPTKGGKK